MKLRSQPLHFRTGCAAIFRLRVGLLLNVCGFLVRVDSSFTQSDVLQMFNTCRGQCIIRKLWSPDTNRYHFRYHALISRARIELVRLPRHQTLTEQSCISILLIKASSSSPGQDNCCHDLVFLYIRQYFWADRQNYTYKDATASYFISKPFSTQFVIFFRTLVHAV
jgi:hypothetical protein